MTSTPAPRLSPCVRPRGRTRSVPLLFSLLAATLLVPSLSDGEDVKSGTPPPGLRVFTCGHSFHVFVYKLLDKVAKSAGIEHQLAGVSSIGGSRVIQHWDVAEEKNLAKAALTAGKVDVLTLSPIWLPDEGIDHFAELAVKHNPNVRVAVQEFWLPNDEYVPVYPLQVRKGTDHNATDLAALRKANDKYCEDMENYVRGINQRLRTEALRVVPVGAAAQVLREKLAAGQAPGLKAQWDLFRDSWGHPQPALQMLDVYCHFCVIYQRSPVGLPTPVELVKGLDKDSAEKLNRLLQEIAWETCTHHPLTGLGEKK